MSGSSHICGLRRDGAVECWDSDAEPLGVIPGPFTQIDLGHGGDSDVSYACGLLADGRITCWYLREDVLERAANGIDNYTKTRCQLRIFGGLTCWDPSTESTSETDKPNVLPDNELDNLLNKLLDNEADLMNRLLNSVPYDEVDSVSYLIDTVLIYTVLETPILLSHKNS